MSPARGPAVCNRSDRAPATTETSRPVSDLWISDRAAFVLAPEGLHSKKPSDSTCLRTSSWPGVRRLTPTHGRKSQVRVADMARIVLSTFGSYCDLFPYIAIARRLRDLGHESILAGPANYRGFV